MNFRQIIAAYSPIKSKNELNKVLALVERNFGVFSLDMELDIRSVIVGEEVLNYFDRIIHDPNPHLEHDNPNSFSNPKLTAKETEEKRKKKAKKKEKKERLLYSNDISKKMLRNRNINKMIQCSSSTPLSKEEAEDRKKKQEVPITPSSNDKDKSSYAWLNKAKNEIKKRKELEQKKSHVSIIYTPMGGMNKRH